MNDETYLRMALEISTLSRCTRLKVGAVFVDITEGLVLSAAFNAPYRGTPACSGVEGACGCVHAEPGALVYWPEYQTAPVAVYVTHQPCSQCARLLLNLGGVQRVRWVHSYRLTEGAELLASAGIDARKCKP